MVGERGFSNSQDICGHEKDFVRVDGKGRLLHDSQASRGSIIFFEKEKVSVGAQSDHYLQDTAHVFSLEQMINQTLFSSHDSNQLINYE